MGRKEIKKLLVVFLTEELHCGEAESEVLVFYPWVITKKNNQHHEIKDILWEEFKKALFLQLFPLRIVNKASFEVEKSLSDTQMQPQGVFQVLSRHDGWNSFWVDGQMNGKWINAYGWLNKPTLTSPWSEKTHNKRASQRSERQCPRRQKRDNAKREKRLRKNTGIHAAPVLV